MTSAPFQAFGEAVRARREELGMTQLHLSERLYMTRQNLAEIESGRRLPRLDTARRLATLLGWTLDALTAHLARESHPHWVMDAEPTEASPVIWTLIGEKLCVAKAGRVAPPLMVDGLWDPVTALVRDVPGACDPASTLFLAGCDPFVSWLWQRTPHPDITLYVFSMGSLAALQALAEGAVHLAGSHLFDQKSRRYNRFDNRFSFKTRRFPYLMWDSGALGAIQSPDQWVVKEPGSEARALFERQRGMSDSGPLVELDSHWAIARYVARHPHTAGVGIGAVALAMNLPFLPWTREPFEWITREEWTRDPRIRAFEQWLQSYSLTDLMQKVPGIIPLMS